MTRPATVAQRADEWYVSTFYKVLMASMLDRALSIYLQTRTSAAAAAAKTQLEGFLEGRINDVETHLHYEAIAIRTLVQVQYGAMLECLGRIE